MFRRMIIPALASAALASSAAWGQSTVKDDSVSVRTDDGGQQVMQKIHDELTAEGYKDVKVVPSSFIVSGKNKDGKSVMLLIGPTSMTMVTPADPDQTSQLPEKDGKGDQIWQ